MLDRRSTRAAAGHHTLRFRFTVPPGRYEVRLTARGGGDVSPRAVDRITIFPGGVLTVAAARSVVARVVRDNADAGYDFPRRCRAFGRRRVDCAVTGGGLCQFVDAVVLHRDGAITDRSYRSDVESCRFQARPRWDGDATPQIP